MTNSLVVAPQWIGDAVMTEPLLALLASRGERLSVAALPWVAPVYRAMPQVADVIELPFAHGRLDWHERRRIARDLRGRFDAAYVLPNSIKAALIPWLARIPRRVGYHGEGRWGLLNQRLPNPPGRPPMVAFYSALASSPAGANDASRGGSPSDAPHQTASDKAPVAAARLHPRLSFDAPTLRAATTAAGVQAGTYWVFAPGAEYGPAKCWPADHYAALARSLHARHGQPVLLLGSGKEAALCEQIAQAAPGACTVLAGRTTLIDAMALIAAARGVVSNDSGLMHVAAAFGVPQAAVFGSTSPEHTPPLNPRAQVLWLKHELALDCSPCFERTCRFGHTRCLTEVMPQRVEQALDKALDAVPEAALS
ncbi:MAG: lipopolysaccharide heptosyltransferase [Methylibium sp. NZG]|nr:MAG: lipopolysaccharide heptosyltransferase [Methylibium sp. NZG]